MNRVCCTGADIIQDNNGNNMSRTRITTAQGFGGVSAGGHGRVLLLVHYCPGVVVAAALGEPV